MVEYKEDYILPTAVSFIACLIFLFTIMFYMTSVFAQKMNPDVNKDSIAFDVIIKNDKNKMIKKQIVQKKLARSYLKSTLTQQTLSKKAKTTSSVDDLFANLDEKYDNVIEKKASNSDYSKVASKKKAKLNEQAKYSSKDVADILNSIDETFSPSSGLLQSDSKQTNAYYAKIRKILASRWSPLSSMSGDIHAMVVVKIDADGTFSYKFLSYSLDDMFNENLILFLDSQTTQKYPVYKNGETVVIEVKFGIKGVQL